MQTKYPVDGAQLCRLDQLLMRHLHRMQGALQLLLPKGKEALQLRKIRKQIVVLPNIRLQRPAMIWTPVQDLSSRQAKTTDLFFEV
jgi:hypothetical protein